MHPAAMEAALERHLTVADDGRGLLGRKALDVAQHDGGAPLGRELRERAFQDRFELAVQRLRLGTELWRVRDRGDQILLVWAWCGCRRAGNI